MFFWRVRIESVRWVREGVGSWPGWGAGERGVEGKGEGGAREPGLVEMLANDIGKRRGGKVEMELSEESMLVQVALWVNGPSVAHSCGWRILARVGTGDRYYSQCVAATRTDLSRIDTDTKPYLANPIWQTLFGMLSCSSFFLRGLLFHCANY